MVQSRIKMPQRVAVESSDLNVVQQRLHDTLQSVLRSPTLDSQQVTGSLANQVTEQTVTFQHALGRVPSGLHVVSSTYLVAATGKQSFTRTTASINVVLTNPGPSGVLTAVVF